MALLTDDIQDKLIELLVNEGLIEKSVIDDALKRASESGKPLFSLLSEEGLLDNELLVHGVAQVSGVPYVNLSNSVISQDILSLLPSDVAERFMAVPLAEVQNRLAVAMIDANNVQAVDYLSNRIQLHRLHRKSLCRRLAILKRLSKIHRYHERCRQFWSMR